MRDYSDPKMFEPLDEEEAVLMKERKEGLWTPVSGELFNLHKSEMKKMARQSLKKTERATIRLTKTDFSGLKIMAAKEGIGYQTLISKILHQTVTGQIKLN